jgi:hypothetical protein
MYWDARGNIFKILKNSLQKSLGLASINIPTIQLWSLKIINLNINMKKNNIETALKANKNVLEVNTGKIKYTVKPWFMNLIRS